MVFNTNIHCNVIFGVKDNCDDTDTLYTFNLIEPPGYMINIIANNVLYQNVTNERIEKKEMSTEDQLTLMVMY